jgi:hypothetical protein
MMLIAITTALWCVGEPNFHRWPDPPWSVPQCTGLFPVLWITYMTYLLQYRRGRLPSFSLLLATHAKVVARSRPTVVSPRSPE